MGRFLKAIGIISGMIIGSGMFALPYAVRVSGFWWGIASACLAYGAILSIHLAYGEVVANNPGHHRLPGYVRIYLGAWWGGIEAIAQIISFNAILLVYGILGGKFLSVFFQSGSMEMWTVLFFIVSAGILLIGSIETISVFNTLLVIPLIGAALWLSVLAFGHGNLSRLSELSASTDPLFAFGVFMFSLAGMSVIADAKSIFEKENSQTAARGLRNSIVVGTTVPFLLYIIFTLGMISVSGVLVTEDALSGLQGILGSWVVQLGALVGFLAVITSYLALGYDLREIYELDRGIVSIGAWALAAGAPLVLFLVGATDFLRLMSLVGGFFVALDGLFIILLLRTMRKRGEIKKQFLPLSGSVLWFLIILLVASACYEVLYQLSG